MLRRLYSTAKCLGRAGIRWASTEPGATTPALHRSVLFVPGSNARALAKAPTLGTDALILDLEDAVAPSAKAEARAQVCAAVRAGSFPQQKAVVRVNSLDTEWGLDDVREVATCGAAAVVFPKIERASQVTEALAALDEAGAPPELPVWCMIETPLGVLNALEVAAAHQRVEALAAGTSDLVKDLRATHTPDRSSVITSLGLIVLAARAAGKLALDGVHLNFKDLEEFDQHCKQARDMGFDGKTLIHPATIAGANSHFSPTEDQFRHACEIIEAHAEAERKGQGVVVLRGQLIENLHVEEAKRVVGLMSAIRAREDA